MTAARTAKARQTGITPEQRHTRARPCQICGGWDNMRRGQGERCAGYRSADGLYDYCERPDYAGHLPMNTRTTPPTAAHRLEGPCKCGATHGASLSAPRAPRRSASPAKSAAKGSAKSAKQGTGEEVLAATYDYYSADAVQVAQKLRYEYPGELTAKGKPRKRFVWRQPDGSGGWLYHRRGVAPVLYRLPEILAADLAQPVYLAEGEKCADAVRGLGLLATTGPDGAPKWDPAYTEALRGRAVIILPDHDAAGWAQLALVAEQIAGAAASVRVLTLEQLTQAAPANGADIADWVAERRAAGASAEELRATLEGAASGAPLYADYAASQPTLAPNAPVARSQGTQRPADALEGPAGADVAEGAPAGAEEQPPTRRGLRVLRPGAAGSADAGPSAEQIIDAGAALECGQGSSVYYIAPEVAPERAGLWVRGRDSARCILSMALQVTAVAASAPREGAIPASLHTLEVATQDGTQALTLPADAETLINGSVWRPLAGLAMSYPQTSSDCDKARVAVAALAVLQRAQRVELVPALGWHTDSRGELVMVRADGTVTADRIIRHPYAPRRAEVPADWPYTLPAPGEEDRAPDARPLLELLRNFWPGSDGDTIDSASGALVSRGTCYPAALLGTLARVRLPGWGTQPGRLDWQLELYGRSGGGKTAFNNLMSCLQGSGFTYNTATLLTQDNGVTAKDTAIGLNGIRAKLPYHWGQDMDYNAPPQGPEWDSQQLRRKALLDSDGNLSNGGAVSMRSGGGVRQRPRPAGALGRTGEHAPQIYTGAAEGANARACTFALPELPEGEPRFSRDVSVQVTEQRAALVALGLAYDRWIIRQGLEGIQLRAAAAVDTVRAELRAAEERLGPAGHQRTKEQLTDMGVGLTLFALFLREAQPEGQIQGAEPLAAWLERQRARLIAERLQWSQRLAAEFSASRGGLGTPEELAAFALRVWRAELKRGRAALIAPYGRSIAPTPQDDTPGVDLPQGVPLPHLGWQERYAGSHEWSMRGQILGYSDGYRAAYLLYSDDAYLLLEEAARKERRTLPTKRKCWEALEQAGALIVGTDREGNKERTHFSPRNAEGERRRMLCLPWYAALRLYPEIEEPPEEPEGDPSGDPAPQPDPAPTREPDLEEPLEEWGPEEEPAAQTGEGQGEELLAGLPDPYPFMWDWRRAAAAHSANGCQPARVWVAGKGSAGPGSGWRALAGRDLFATLASQAQLGNPEPLRTYAADYVRWLAGRAAAAPEPPTLPATPAATPAATPDAPRSPERLQAQRSADRSQPAARAADKPERKTDKATDKPERPERPAVPAVWVPSVWVREPQRANKLGIVCGGWLFVWGTPDPQTAGGVAPLPAQSINLYTPDSAGRTPAEDLAALAELQHAHKLRAVWLLPLEGERPSAADAPIVRDWQRLAQPAALEQRAPWLEWRGIAARALGNSPALAGLTHQPRGERSGEEGEDKPEGKAGAIRRIHAPWVQDAWGLAGTLAGLGQSPAERARLFASGLLLAERALKMQWQYSPSLTGLFLLRETLQPWASRGVDLSPLPEEWQERLAEVRASDVRWARPVTAEEMPEGAEDPEGSGRLWVYDRNSSYVSSARAVPSGVPLEVAEYRPDMPQGVYLCDAAAPDGWDPRTPGPIRAGATGEAGAYPLEVRGAWVWAPYLKLALDHGWRVNVRRGYAWPREQVHETLRTWQGRVWDARRICEGYKAQGGAAGAAGAVAVRLIKRLGVATIGRLIPRDGRTLMDTAAAEAQALPIEWEELDTEGRYTGLAEVRVGLGRTDLVHPEWWSPIIAHAGARLLAATYTHAPTATAGLYIDSLYTLRPCPALEGDPLKTGGYRLKANIALPAALLARGEFSELVTAAARAEREAERTAHTTEHTEHTEEAR